MKEMGYFSVFTAYFSHMELPKKGKIAETIGFSAASFGSAEPVTKNMQKTKNNAGKLALGEESMHTGENPTTKSTESAAKRGEAPRRLKAERVAPLKKAAAAAAYQPSCSDTKEWTLTTEHRMSCAANAKTNEIAIPRTLNNRKNRSGVSNEHKAFFTPRLLRAVVIAIIVSAAAIGGTAVYVQLRSSGSTGFRKLYTSQSYAELSESEQDTVITAGSGENENDYAVANSVFEKYNQAQMSVRISADGKDYTVSAPHLSTVADLLEDMNITLTGEDYTNYPLTMTLEPDMEIRVGRVTYSEYTVTETIPFDTEYRSVQTIKRGSEVIERKGSNGTSAKTYRRRFINGELDSETLVSENVTVYPQTQIVLRGSGGTYTNASGESYSYSYYLDVTATAYSTLSGYTYTGKAIELGMIAVDPSVIPLGTQVYVVGDYGDYGVCSAEDTGGAIIGNKIDIYLGDDMEVLMNFGVRKMRVYILE